MANQSYEKLFQSFPSVTTEQWEALIEKDLKGAPYDKKLIWRTFDGINLRPYYRAENLESLTHLNTLPNEGNYVRGYKTDNNNWEIQQDIEVSDGESANKKALDVLNKGITSLNFLCSGDNDSCAVSDEKQLKALLKDIHFNCIHTNFGCGCKADVILEVLLNEVSERNYDKNSIYGGLAFDPIGRLNIAGKWYNNEKEDIEKLLSLVKKVSNELPNYKLVKIRGCHLHNSGANIIQELAYVLAIANEYLTIATEKEVDIDTIAPLISLSFGVGSNYFMEIAKIRAARVLWAKMLEAYQPKNDTSKKVFIHCNTSRYNQTVYDSHNNMLRATTEAMSAIIGGCNSLNVKPFDASFKNPNTFSERIARNVQIILKEEAYFDKIVDPSAGSYYVETITELIIESAWNEFLAIEEKGGYLIALKEGYIQQQIEESAQKREMRVAQRRDVLVGTNQYPNYYGFKYDAIDMSIAFKEHNTDGEIVKPIAKSRVAQEFEKLRLATEKSGKQPKVFMFTYGNLAMRKARATFSMNFFACAGYEVIDNLGFKTIEDGVKAAADNNADIVVLCSSDDEYADMAPEAYKQLKDKCIVVVAGAPACADNLKTQGIEHFIHMRSNVLETLQNFNTLLGI